MKVILSIRPEYVQRIFAGEKKFEFRRSIFRNKGVTSVIVYASAPIRKVIGELRLVGLFAIHLRNYGKWLAK